MKTQSILKLFLLAIGIALIASCTKPISTGNEGIHSSGLGHLTRFSDQEPGEAYTTQAPHNQIYLFAYDSSSLAPKYRASLFAQADYLKNHPGARILLTGHTDERGSREYNVALGERRANTVAELLRLAGVNKQQVRLVSYGKERPANYGHDELSRQQNRRVEFIYEATK